MKRSRFLTVILSIVMCVSSLLPCLPASAEENAAQQPVQSVDMNTELHSTNSFGKLLTSSLTDAQKEQLKSTGTHVVSIEMENGIAKVRYQTRQEADLVIGIYDEAGETLLGSGHAAVLPEEHDAEIPIEISEWPEYYLVRGFLTEPVTLAPLSPVFECNLYTKEMVEFLSKTTADFDDSLVLNLDDDNTTNFAVYKENVIQLHPKEGFDTIVSADDENDTFVFENPDEALLALKKGDIFAYATDETIVIAKVAELKQDGSRVTMTGSDFSAEDVFTHIRIDNEQGMDDAELEPAEGIEVEEPENAAVSEGGIGVQEDDLDDLMEIGPSVGGTIKLRFKIVDKKIGDIEKTLQKKKYSGSSVQGASEAKVSLDVGATFGASGKYYFSLSQSYFEFSITYDIGVDFSLSGKVAFYVPFGKVAFKAPKKLLGFRLSIRPSIELSFSGKMEASLHVHGSRAYRAVMWGEAEDLSYENSKSFDVDVEGRIFIGVSLRPTFVCLSEHIFSASLTGEFGFEFLVKHSDTHSFSELADDKRPDAEYHDCKACLEIEVNLILNSTFTCTFPFKIECKLTLLDYKFHVATFYYSIDYNQFGYGECPHKLLLSKIHVRDNLTKENIANVAVTFPRTAGDVYYFDGYNMVNAYGETLYTDENGVLEVYLASGKNTYKLEKEGYSPEWQTINVRAAATLNRSATGEITEGIAKVGADALSNFLAIEMEKLKNDVTTPVKPISLGGNHSAAIAEDGSLYLWGQNYYGQLGDGTKEDKYTPVKIMDNVKAVSLGADHSAAITKDGSLYLWGNDVYGQLGDNNSLVISPSPVKIMDNVKTVSLGAIQSAATTEDGSLYVWGNNQYGQLGDGTKENRYTPVKIMDNVKAVSLGGFHGAAITEDGSLYMWGNTIWEQDKYGQLLDHSMDSILTPVKIMDNVKAVSLGDGHSAALKEDGSLYLWGSGVYGRIGNGTEEQIYSPVKIMDNVKDVALGSFHSAAITEDGSLYMWGQNNNGQLGDGTKEDKYTPVKIMDDVKAVSLGEDHSAALTEDGSLYLWGQNFYGQLGDGTKEDRKSPTQIGFPPISAETFVQTYNAPRITAVKDVVEIEPYEPVAQSGTKAFTDLLPDTRYNFYIFAAEEADDKLSPENLLWISQFTSDANGAAEVPYAMRMDFPPAVMLAVPAENDIAGAQITGLEYTYDGGAVTAEPVVTLNGTVLRENEDYVVFGEKSAAEPGDYVLEFWGTGDYTGSICTAFSVKCPHDDSADKCGICGEIRSEALLSGDVNADYRLSVADAVLLSRILAETEIPELREESLERADIDGDGILTVLDIRKLLKMIA